MAEETAPQKDTAPEKLISGKYKTVEEAERAIKEAERSMHAANQRAADAERRAGAAEQKLDTRGNTTAGSADDDSVFQRFTTAPNAFLNEFGQGIVKAAVQVIEPRMGQFVETAIIVNDFLRDRPLAKKHGTLFKALYAEAQGNTILEKLDDAHKRLESELRPAKDEARKQARAEQKANRKAELTAGAEDEGEGEGSMLVTEDSDAEDSDSEDGSFDTYMKNRNQAFTKIKTVA